MARATRSATSHEKDKPADNLQASRKGASKKRKRNSNAENEDSLPAKLSRTDSKEDDTPESDDYPDDKKHNPLPSSGDIPIQSADAADVLEVLERFDTQGLLDRVFPLPMDSAEAISLGSSSGSGSSMVSLRSVLRNPAHYPLSLLRAAVKHLHPISSHPRSRPSETAAQQLRFCNLALSLLDQASHNTAPVPLDTTTIFSENESQDDANTPTTTTSQGPPVGVRPKKYALVQRLPTGEWWTSASSVVLTGDGNGRDPRTLSTAKAELVSVFPSTSGSQLAHKGTLGEYAVRRVPMAPYKPPPARRVSCGKFLDYGPYASFAPSFDQDGVEVGRIGMGEVIYHQEMKRRLRSLAKGKRRAFLSSVESSTEDVTMDDVASIADTSIAGSSENSTDMTKGLDFLLSPEEVRGIKSTLATFDMEQAVDELLQKNGKALQRLEELQLERLCTQGRLVEVGSEEWDVAQGILDSLGLLASLRPRPSNGDPDHAPLIPPASVLHKLQRTLPLAATEGWYGTLPEGRTTAFHDDTTVHVRVGAVSTSKAVPVPATPVSKSTISASQYTPYAYPGNYQASPYRGGYGTYTPSQGSANYYPNTTYNASTPQQTTHYPNSQYGTSATNQFYASWYANSGRSTPQPTSAQPSLSGNYSSYFASTTQPQRAVANTVLSSAKQPSYQAAAWNGATTGGYPASTLPPHMRSAVTGAGTPPPTTPTVAGTYYGGYTAPR